MLAVLAVAAAAGALVVLAARLVVAGRAELAAGAEARGRGDRAEALRRFARAAGLYVPGAPHVRGGLDGLAGLAAEARASGDRAFERASLEAVRAALLGARSFYVPRRDRLAAANRRLAELYAELEAGAPTGASPTALSGRQRAALHLARLEQAPRAPLGPAVAALAGAGLWLVAAALFFRRGIDPSVRPRLVWALTAAAGFVVGLALLLAGLRAA